MKKYLFLILTLIAAIALITAGCRPGGAPQNNSTNEQPPDAAPPNFQDDGPMPERIAGLTKDEYDGIEITVNVLERNAILPGMVFQATVTVENKGEETVSYVKGSGSYKTPEALFVYSNTLQPVIPEDQLGFVTMDFVTDELKPGESLLFKFNVLAIEPDPDFDTFTHELFSDEIYIANLEWSDLQARFPSLTAAQPGNYTLRAFFLYRLFDETGEFAAFEGPTAYAEAEALIGIS